MLIKYIEQEDIDACAKIAVSAYSKEPWNENHDIDEMKKVLTRFISNDAYIGWTISRDQQIIGFTIGIIVPSIGEDYFRIEDICIDPNMQRKGIGRKLIKEIEFQLKAKNINSIVLNTIKEFPAYKFYLNIGFVEIESSSTMILEI